MYMSKLFLFAAFKSDKWSSYIVTRVEKFTQKLSSSLITMGLHNSARNYLHPKSSLSLARRPFIQS